MSQLGQLTTLFALGSILGRPLAGFITDRQPPNFVLGAVLLLTGCVNIALASTSNVWAWLFLNGLNGVIQAGSWGPVSKVLATSYDHSERGTYWAGVCAARTVALSLLGSVSGALVASYGCFSIMNFSGLFAILVAGTIFICLKPKEPKTPSPAPKSNGATQKSEASQNAYQDLKADWSPQITSIICVEMTAAFIRNAFTELGMVILINGLEFSISDASSTHLYLHFGGLIGSMLSGYLSDKYFKSNRIRVIQLSSLFTLLFLSCFFFSSQSVFINSILFFFLGLLIEAPCTLSSLILYEASPPRSAGLIQGIDGIFYKLGESGAGIPLSLAIDHLGWTSFFGCLVISCGSLILFSSRGVGTLPDKKENGKVE